MSTLPAAPPPLVHPPKLPLEEDEGYGESHGYGPGHSGPSGPGDAPAKQPPAAVPVDDPSEKEEP
jgi:hypothetical protein